VTTRVRDHLEFHSGLAEVKCDGCGDTVDLGDEGEEAMDEARAWAIATYGWTYVPDDGADYCPKCLVKP